MNETIVTECVNKNNKNTIVAVAAGYRNIDNIWQQLQ